MSNSQNLSALSESAAANKSKYNYKTPSQSILEAFELEYYHGGVEVEIEAPEFTCLCPVTGQPDFATISVRYFPRKKCVESKSFKLYLMAFRQVGMFHEEIVRRICDDLVCVIKPRSITVVGHFQPRGGIRFTPRATYLE